MAGFNLHNCSTIDHSNYNFDGLELQHLLSWATTKLSVQAPKNYPIYLSENQRIFCEGYLYNFDHISIGEKLLEFIDSDQQNEIPKLIEGIDGEFVFILQSNDGSIYLVNDRWSHLPVYIFERDGEFIISRNISFITRGVQVELDRMNVALMLLLGTNLQTSTLWKGISRLAPHSVVKINRASITETSFFEIQSFEGKARIDEIIDPLWRAVNKSTSNRLKRLPNPSLSLSGGLDSRLAAASICAVSDPIPFITHDRKSGIDKPDRAAAEDICRRLNISKYHEIVALDDDQLKDSLELLELKQGLNCISMGHVLPFHKLFRDRELSCISDYGGGGKFFRKIYPNIALKNLDELVNYILKFHASAPLKVVARLCKVDESSLTKEITKDLDGYPFQKMDDKYAYFIFREVLINWAFEADRQRNYSWVSVPFYDPEVIRLCFSIPQQSKDKGQLFKALFDKYPGNLSEVNNPNWKLPLTDEKGLNRLFKRQALKAKLYLWLILQRKNTQLQDFKFRNELNDAVLRNSFFDSGSLPWKGSLSFYWQLLTLALLTKDKD